MTLGSRPGHQALYPSSDQIFHGNCPQGAAGPWIRQLPLFKSNLWARTQQRVFNWSQHFWQLRNGSLHPEGELGYLGGPPTCPAEEMTSNVAQPPPDRSDSNSQLGLSGVPPLPSPLPSPRPLVMVLFYFISYLGPCRPPHRSPSGGVMACSPHRAPLKLGGTRLSSQSGGLPGTKPLRPSTPASPEQVSGFLHGFLNRVLLGSTLRPSCNGPSGGDLCESLGHTDHGRLFGESAPCSV